MSGELLQILGYLLSGGLFTALVNAVRNRKQDSMALVKDFYPMWQQELDRWKKEREEWSAERAAWEAERASWQTERSHFRQELDRLHKLIGAFEAELISLGGDPFRIKERYTNGSSK